MTVVLRPATADDLPVVGALEEELFGPDAWNLAQLHEELTGPGRRFLVAEEGTQVVGYGVTRVAADVVDLERVAVSPARRRSGVASYLLAELQSLGRDDLAHRMLVEVSAANTGAVAFYAARDFVQIDRRPRYYRDGTDALVMRATLGTTGCSWRNA